MTKAIVLLKAGKVTTSFVVEGEPKPARRQRALTRALYMVTEGHVWARMVVDEAGGGRIEHVPFETVFGRGFVDPQRRVPDLGRLRALSRLEAPSSFRPEHDVRAAIRDLLAADQPSSGAGSVAAISPPKLSATALKTQRSTSPKA